jgi:hypothetical protein
MIPYYAMILFDEADAWNEAWEVRTFTGVVSGGSVAPVLLAIGVI